MDSEVDQHGHRAPTPAYTPPAWAYAHHQKRNDTIRTAANRRRVFVGVIVMLWLMVFYTGFNIYHTVPVGARLLYLQS